MLFFSSGFPDIIFFVLTMLSEITIFDSFSLYINRNFADFILYFIPLMAFT